MKSPFTEGLHIYSYLVGLDKLYGNEYLDFEPETIRGDLGLSDETLSRIMAGIVLKTTSGFWCEITTFEKIALALNNRSVSFGEYQELSPAEIAWAVMEAGFITYPEPLDSDVQLYIAKILYDEGYSLAPFPLGEVQDELDLINKKGSLDQATEENRQVIQQAKRDAVNNYLMQQMMALLEEMEIG